MHGTIYSTKFCLQVQAKLQRQMTWKFFSNSGRAYQLNLLLRPIGPGAKVGAAMVLPCRHMRQLLSTTQTRRSLPARLQHLLSNH